LNTSQIAAFRDHVQVVLELLKHGDSVHDTDNNFWHLKKQYL